MSEEKARNYIYDEVQKKVVEHEGRIIAPLLKDYRPLKIISKRETGISIESDHCTLLVIERTKKSQT